MFSVSFSSWWSVAVPSGNGTWLFRGYLSLSSCQTKGCKVFRKNPLLWKQLFMHGSVHNAMCTNFYPDLRFTFPGSGIFEALSSLELNKMVPLCSRVCAQHPWSKSVCFHIAPAGFAPGHYLKMILCLFWKTPEVVRPVLICASHSAVL